MDKHNNEIYKNWYSTNINGEKNLSPTITVPYPLPEMHDVCREYWSPCTSFFFISHHMFWNCRLCVPPKVFRIHVF